MQFTFEKITCAKREKTCREEKIPAPPPTWISNGPSLSCMDNVLFV